MRHRVAVLSVIAWGISAPAAAQVELGAGNALDANLGTTTGRFNAPAANPNYRGRNLLVTGDVAGGRGFRGTVGYTAQYDFRGELGSNDLFVERANMALSGPNILAAGRTLERMRFGQFRGEIEFRRSGFGSSPRSLNEQQYVRDPSLEDRLNLDHLAISSTTSAIYETTGDGRIVGLLQNQEGQRLVASASSLFGLQVIPTERYGKLIGLSSYDMARATEDIEAGRQSARLGDPFEMSFEDLRVTGRPPETEAVDSRVEPEVVQGRIDTLQPSYREIKERIEQRWAAGQPQEPDDSAVGMVPLDEQFDQLRELLAGVTPPSLEGPVEGEPEPGAGRPGLPAGINPMTMPLRHDTYLDRLTGESESRFQELLASGEEQLRAGEYFRAEQRFQRALRFTPGHPLATAGMGHAQIGAGFYAPAALTLRRLLIQRPEMIDVRYGPDVLPSRVRLDIAVGHLRERLPEDRDRALHAFLLAYIGHQLDRRELIEQGLEVMGEASPDDVLHALLERIWLD
ncbi:MAG: tetratricopeptide repeat protein [Planctomycetota bacterium]|jgi:hypothetical protein